MAYRKISRDVKFAALRLYKRRLLLLRMILDCIGISKRTFHRIVQLWRHCSAFIWKSRPATSTPLQWYQIHETNHWTSPRSVHASGIAYIGSSTMNLKQCGAVPSWSSQDEWKRIHCLNPRLPGWRGTLARRTLAVYDWYAQNPASIQRTNISSWT